MKERPIIFNTEMVRAILDGRKTQTRRVVKYKAYTREGDPVYPHECPYGEIGDRLWVRETWAYTDGGGALVMGGIIETVEPQIVYKANGYKYSESLKWKPSIHMPRWASRITLEITDVRVERARDISYGDLCKEGFKTYGLSEKSEMLPASIWFQELWDSLNAKRGYSWKSNPWVWVIEFKPITTITD